MLKNALAVLVVGLLVAGSAYGAPLFSEDFNGTAGANITTIGWNLLTGAAGFTISDTEIATGYGQSATCVSGDWNNAHYEALPGGPVFTADLGPGDDRALEQHRDALDLRSLPLVGPCRLVGDEARRGLHDLGDDPQTVAPQAAPGLGNIHNAVVKLGDPGLDFRGAPTEFNFHL